MPDSGGNDYIPSLIEHEYYVAPDTDILILRSVPLDNTYEHTIVWENLDAERSKQRNYFLSMVKYRIDRNSYQRVNREWFKVSINAEYLYDCNYIMFRNTAFNEYKWFYAFIVDVEYINNNTAKIKYEVDVMQTWLPGPRMDYQMMPCFVERCHSKSDELFENLVPESIVQADEYLVDQEVSFDMNKMSVICLTTEKYEGSYILGGPYPAKASEFKPVHGKAAFGTYGAVDITIWNIFNSDGTVNLQMLVRLSNYLGAYVAGGKENSVLSVMMYPSYLIPETFDNIGGNSDQYSLIEGRPKFTTSLTNITKYTAMGGRKNSYIPKNAKLYSYPFNIIRVNNECGTTRVYKWELFDNDNDRGKFTVEGARVWQPCAVIYPHKYRGIEKNMEDSVTFNAFPVCPWSSDAFRAWWAQNAAQVTTTAIGGAASLIATIAGGASGNPMLMATGAGGVISSAAKIGTSLYEANHRPAAEHGSTETSLMLPALKNMKFVVTRESLRPEMLQIYDDFFTKYGYAQKRIMTPSLVNRAQWTYVQTVGFEFTGKINDTDTKKIKSIFDNGITFWRNPVNIGNYNLLNYPTG